MPDTVLENFPEAVRIATSPVNSKEMQRMTGIRSSFLDTIDQTPIVRINNIGPGDVALYVKLEAFNPMGSVKDRLALGVIEAARNRRAISVHANVRRRV